jgi:hypothetical protein
MSNKIAAGRNQLVPITHPDMARAGRAKAPNVIAPAPIHGAHGKQAMFAGVGGQGHPVQSGGQLASPHAPLPHAYSTSGPKQYGDPAITHGHPGTRS